MPTPRPAGQLPVLRVPVRPVDDPPDALGEPDRADAEPVRGQRVRLRHDVEPQLRRIQPEPLGDLVELHLLAEARLRRAVSALGAARRLVGEDARALELVARQLVGHGLERAGVEGARDAVRTVAAAVDQRLQVHPGQPAVLRHAGAEPHQHRVPAAVHVEHLFPRETDFHRAAEHQGRLRDHRFVVAQVALAAEPAAVRSGDDAHVRRGDAQHAREHPVDVVRHLGARPERELAVGVDRRERGMLLDREMRVALEEEQVLENVVRPAKSFVDVAELERLQPVDVAALAVVVDARALGRERLFRRRDRRERPVLHVDQVERFERGELVLRDNRRHRVADVAHAVRGERVFVLRHRQDAERDRELLPCQDQMHAWHRGGAGDVDRLDRGVRDRRARELAVEHARQRDVVGEARLPGDLRAAVDAAARLADDVEPLPQRAHRTSFMRRAASSTASKICWYPVQRQRLPDSASLIRSRPASGSFSNSAFAVIRIPGVQ